MHLTISHRRSRAALALVALLALSSSLIACCPQKDEPKESAASESKTEAPEAALAPAAGTQGETGKSAKTSDDDKSAGDAATLATFVGTIVKKPWTKSAESWDAGGSEYFVLELESAQGLAIAGTTILRATDAVTATRFDELAGKKVEVRGTTVEATPYVPQDPSEQYPTAMDGTPLPRGSGFAVKAITVVK